MSATMLCFKSKGIITLVRDAVLDAGHDFHIRRLSDSFATWFVYCDVLGRCAKGVVHWVKEIGIICKETARVEVKRLLAVQPSVTATFLGVDILSIQQNDNCYKISDGQNSFQKYFKNRKLNSFKSILKILLQNTFQK